MRFVRSLAGHCEDCDDECDDPNCEGSVKARQAAEELAISRIEAEIVKKLLPHEPDKAATLTVQFDISERQRGDTAAQVSLIAAGRQWGILSANQGLNILGLPAIGPEGDVRMVPVNMQAAQRLLDPPKAAPTEQVVQDAQS